MRRTSRLVVVLLLPAALLSSAACDNAAPSTPTAGPPHNDGDVAFVEALIPHHRAGIELAREVAGQPAHAVLAKAIISTEQDEITRMTGWLATWGAPEPSAPGKPAPPGDPVAALAAHQEEAVTLAQREQAQGSNPAALAFARQVVESRTAEAAELRSAG